MCSCSYEQWMSSRRKFVFIIVFFLAPFDQFLLFLNSFQQLGFIMVPVFTIQNFLSSIMSHLEIHYRGKMGCEHHFTQLLITGTKGAAQIGQWFRIYALFPPLATVPLSKPTERLWRRNTTFLPSTSTARQPSVKWKVA